MKKLIKTIPITILLLSSVLLLILFSKGQKGNPLAFQSDHDTAVGGPFELSNSTARYALTEAIVEDHSFFFNDTKARFASPDLTQYKGKYFSIFMPGVSFLAIPLYVLGKQLNVPQLFSYASTTITAFLNIFLITRLAKKLGANTLAGLIGGFVFVFATNAFSFAMTFTQHHFAVTLLLLALLNTLKNRTWISNLEFGILCGLGILFDVPNIFLLLPVGLYIVFKHFWLVQRDNKIGFRFKINLLGILFGMLPLVILLGWYNYQLTGSYTKLAQNIGRSLYPPDAKIVEKPKEVEVGDSPTNSKIKLPFKSRKMLSGFYTLIGSDERSWIYYSPIVWLGILGIGVAARRKDSKDVTLVGLCVIVINYLLYAMFGDPWGGWSFGARYLIPAAGVMSVFLAVAIDRFYKRWIFALVFFPVVIYSLAINAIGAATTNLVPPKVEAVNLSEPIPYTYQRNMQLVETGFNSSLIYNLLLPKIIDSKTFITWTVVSETIVLSVAYLFLSKFDQDKII